MTQSHKIRNRIQTVLLVAGICLLPTLIARLILGPDIWLWLVASLLLIMFSLPSLSPYWVLRLYGAHPVDPRQSPPLYSLVSELSRRAGLATVPRLYWIPSQTLNAFAVGNAKNSAIAVSEGLIQLLSPRELAGAMAHEISHIRNNDLRLMMLADLFSRLTYLLSLTGFLTILIALPWIFIGDLEISIPGLLLMIFSPTISALLQLGLSRVREFNADLEAARLTGDPTGLAQALLKIDQQNQNPWLRIFIPSYRDPHPSILRSHPETQRRIQRLLTMQTPQSQFEPHFHRVFHPFTQVSLGKPKHHFFTGIWR